MPEGQKIKIPEGIRITTSWAASDADVIVDLHRRGYADQDPIFHDPFPDFVAQTITESGIDQPGQGRLWVAEKEGMPVGCCAIAHRGKRCQFRWFIVVPEVRGTGLGKYLFYEAMSYARAGDWNEIYLETVDGLDASVALYRRDGFVETSRESTDLWFGQGDLVIMSLKLK